MQQLKGFTLLETSIVIIIMGFLISGIFVGQTMFRTANLNSVLADAARYSSAFSDFQEKYNALPGDLFNAESFWGTPAGGCPNNNGVGTQVCNGNGDGQVCNANNAANIAELHSEWVELANAGFISSSYTYTSAASTYQVGVDTPATAIGNGTFMFYYATCLIGDGLYTSVMPYNIHWLSFGRLLPSTGTLLPIINGGEGYNIDKKTDDGLPATGRVRAGRNGTIYDNTPNCQTTNDPLTAKYNNTTNNDACFMMFALSQ